MDLEKLEAAGVRTVGNLLALAEALGMPLTALTVQLEAPRARPGHEC